MREELRKLRGDVERRRKAMQELYLDKVSGLIDSAQFFEMNKSFLDEVSSAEARIEKLESELEQQKEESATIQTQMQRVRELAQVSQLTRELVVLLVHRVIVSPKDPIVGEQKSRLNGILSEKALDDPLGCFRPPRWGIPHWKQRLRYNPGRRRSRCGLRWPVCPDAP